MRRQAVGSRVPTTWRDGGSPGCWPADRHRTVPHRNVGSFHPIDRRGGSMRARRVLAALTVAVTAGTVLSLAGAAAAAPADLFISEYVEGSSNNKALELYNGTGAPVDLAANGYVVQFYFNGSTSAGTTVNLTGTVADGDVFVLAPTTAAAAILAQADQTTTSSFYNGDDAVVLRRGGTTGQILDVIGQVGVDPGTEWGTG